MKPLHCILLTPFLTLFFSTPTIAQVAAHFIVLKSTPVATRPDAASTFSSNLPRGYTFYGDRFGDWIFSAEARGFVPAARCLQISTPSNQEWTIQAPIQQKGKTQAGLLLRAVARTTLHAFILQDGQMNPLFTFADRFNLTDWRFEGIFDFNDDGSDDFLLVSGNGYFHGADYQLHALLSGPDGYRVQQLLDITEGQDHGPFASGIPPHHAIELVRFREADRCIEVSYRNYIEGGYSFLRRNCITLNSTVGKWQMRTAE